MQSTQLELKLWEDLKKASATPDTADLVQLWQELEAALDLLPYEQRLQTSGKAIEQIVEVFALREDAIAGLVRQTMTLDLSELMESPAPEQRQPRTQPTLSVAGPVDKAALLEAFSSEIEAVEGEAQRQSCALSTAHSEDVAGWATAIAHWFAEQESGEPASLIQLQQGLGLPLIEVWLVLLLAQEPQYQLEQQSKFYDASGIWLQVN